ncbi:MAG: FMN-binding protein [Ruminococcaceae bacterium]|nr:FMN-binding protein [Oscillospiraceae bacterium]
MSKKMNNRANNPINNRENDQANKQEKQIVDQNEKQERPITNQPDKQENQNINQTDNRQISNQTEKQENKQSADQTQNRGNKQSAKQPEKQENERPEKQTEKKAAKQPKAQPAKPAEKPQTAFDNFKPTIVLTCITTIVALLLVVTHQFTYVDTSNMITDKLMSALTEVMGEGDYSIVSDWNEYGAEKPENVEKLIKKADGSLAFEIVTDGYSKKGLDLVIAMNSDGSVKGVSVVSLGETPGLGTKVQNESFLSQFAGKKGEVEIVKNAPAKDSEVQGVTGATYSSKGVAKAVNIAIDTYGKLKIQNTQGEVK